MTLDKKILRDFFACTFFLLGGVVLVVWLGFPFMSSFA
jgi:TRAP-type mannitol/chloroaromatic compound transport system permease small subunit